MTPAEVTAMLTEANEVLAGDMAKLEAEYTEKRGKHRFWTDPGAERAYDIAKRAYWANKDRLTALAQDQTLLHPAEGAKGP